MLIVLLCAVTSGATGCMGHQGLSGKVRDFNMDATENRWGREALFVVLFPVTYVTGWLDVFLFDSIEFWTGTNPINDKSPALVDVHASALEKEGIPNVASAHMRFMRDQIQMDVIYEDGTFETLNAEQHGERYRFFRGDELQRAETEAHL